MLKRILLSGVVALLCQVSLAADEPAWGLIVKLKTDAAASSTPTGKAFSQSLTTPASARARIATVMQHAGLPSAAQRALSGTGLYHVGTDRVLSHAQAAALASQLMASGAVEWAVPNEREHLQQVAKAAADPYFLNGDQWWAQAASGTNADPTSQQRRGLPNLTYAWDTSTGTAGPIVAVLDTGLISHEDLDAARILPGRNFHHGIDASGQISTTLDPNDPNDYTDPGDGLTQAEKDANPTVYANCEVLPSSWHGTAVTGVIAATANNNLGIAGANWGARVLPVRIAGKCGAWESDIIDAMNWVAGDSSNGNVKRADVINLSFGGNGACDALYQETLRALKQRGVAVIVAAGNDHGAVSRPANCAGLPGIENLASVAALNRDGYKAAYSNFGTEVTLSTVGGDAQNPATCAQATDDCGILTLGNSGATTVDTSPSAQLYYYYEGTSMAAPITSAVAALVLSVNPSLTSDQVISTLRVSARAHQTDSGLPTCSPANPGNCTCTTQTCGAGMLDAYQALQVAHNNPPQAIVTAPPENQGGGGGGGSVGLVALLGLAGLTGAIARQVKAR